MLLTVSDKEYKNARKRGFLGSFAEFAEMCNRENSSRIESMYQNDIGFFLAPSLEKGLEKDSAVSSVTETKAIKHGRPSPKRQYLKWIVVILALYGSYRILERVL